MRQKLPITVLYLEDEMLIAEDMLRKLTPLVNRVIHVSSLKEARAFFATKEKVDLLVFDIHLSDGSSFQLFDEFQIQQPVIFATAFDEYAIRAFKVNSIDYLLKPIDDDQLGKAIEKFEQRNQLNVFPDITNLLSQLSEKEKKTVYRERFLMQMRNTQVVIKVSDIVCFVRDQLLYAYSFQGEKYIVDFESLDLLEEELNPDVFFRTNRQSIVNINAIEKFRADTAGKLYVKLQKGYTEEIDVSREKAKAFKTWLER